MSKKNDDIDWDVVRENPSKPWHYSKLSSRRDPIPWDIIQANLEKPWNWRLLTQNKGITWEIIQANPDLPWEWSLLSLNPNITLDIIKANQDKLWNLNYYKLNHLFELSRKENINSVRRFMAARRIQRTFKEAYSNPNYKMCRDRLRCEFESMAGSLG